LETGRHTEAETAYTEALDLYGQIGDRKRQANALINLGRVLLETGRHAEAEANCNEALELARPIGYWQDQVFALSQLGRLRQMVGDHARVGAFFREKRQVQDRPGEVREHTGHGKHLPAPRLVATANGGLIQAGG
jgi:tetratricopeptide (TPR) repeat protein